MRSLRQVLRKRKDRSPSVEAQSNAFDRARSVDAKKEPEKRVAYRLCKRRKVEFLEEASEATTSDASRTVKQDNKIPRRVHYPTTCCISSRKTKLANNSREGCVPLRATKRLPPRPDVALLPTETKLRVTRIAPLSKRFVRDFRGLQREELEADALKEKIVELQKEADQAQKTVQEQQQTLEDLKRELAASRRINRRQGNQIDKLKSVSRKSKDQLNAIQENLQCQICFETLSRPHTLVPCGHVLCQRCLQNWFRISPRQDERDAEELPTIQRIKTCPCCRSRINNRPVPVFVLKNVLATFTSNDPMNVDDASTDTDPWKNIFPPEVDLTEVEGRELAESDDLDSDDESTSSSSTLEHVGRLRNILIADPWEVSSTETEDEDETSSVDNDPFHEMRPPLWVPARGRYDIPRQLFLHESAERLELLQRGATLQMIERYNMRFDADEGIVAWTHQDVEVYLGWNILLTDDDFPDGRKFMSWVERNMHNEPERWLHQESDDHAVIRRLLYWSTRQEILTVTAMSDDGSVDEDEDEDEDEESD